MDRCSKLVVVLCLAWWSGIGHAGYAYPANPPGFSGAAGAWQYQAAAANDSIAGGIARSPTGPVVNTGGRTITIGAGYRFASNAARYAARGIPPWIAIGVTLAPIILNWIRDGGFDVQGGQMVKSDPNVCTVAPCYQYTYAPSTGYWPTRWEALQKWAAYSTANTAGYTYPMTYVADSVAANGDGNYHIVYTDGRNPLYAVAPAWAPVAVAPSQPTWLPVTPQEFEDGMAPRPLPDALPFALPYPLPVDIPWMNPSPGADPVSQPLRLPQGLPQPVPGTNPQQYRTPVIDVVPAPAPGAPFRVDIVPREITTESPLPLPESSVPSANPDPVAEPEKTQDLCEKYPDILACQKVVLDELTPEPIKNMDRALAITPDSGWGPSNGSCPAPRTAVVMGVNLSMPFTMICDLATAIRPLMIGFAWLSSALVFFGLGRKE